MDFPHRVVNLLAQLGYQEETPDSIAATCRGSLKRVWEFLLANARPASEVRAVEAAVDAWRRRRAAADESAARAARAVELRARLAAARRERGQLERALAARQEELRLQTAAVAGAAREALLAERQRRDAELMVCVGGGVSILLGGWIGGKGAMLYGGNHTLGPIVQNQPKFRPTPSCSLILSPRRSPSSATRSAVRTWRSCSPSGARACRRRRRGRARASSRSSRRSSSTSLWAAAAAAVAAAARR